MADATDLSGLVLDLVEWVARGPRTYAETMEAWRTSCPRLPVWEEAMERRLIRCEPEPHGSLMVRATPLGLAWGAGRHHARQ